MAKSKVKYKCSSCGQPFSYYMGKCNSCGKFGTIIEEVETELKEEGSYIKEIAKRGVNKAVKMTEVKANKYDRIVTGLQEFDRLLGGGFVKDSVSILSAPPGTGKSTLTTIISNMVADKGYKVLYATGEESSGQVKVRMDRLVKKINKDNLYLISENSLENIIHSAIEIDADLIIVDSIQAVNLSHIDGVQGGNRQSLECAKALTTFAKDKDRPRCVLMISQMTKGEDIKGANELQHLVDTVMIMNGEDELKTCYTNKNRFGALEVAMFKHTDSGFEEVLNPSIYFITERLPGEEVFGCALSVIKEGTRPLVIEVESTVSKSFTPYPSRLVQGFKRDELNVMISILEQRANIFLYDKNVIISALGGLIIKESTVKLAVLMSIVSSVKQKPIDSKTVFVGEVGLTGDIKKVSSLEARIREADRLGFNEIIIPDQKINMDISKLSIKVSKYRNINKLIEKLF